MPDARTGATREPPDGHQSFTSHELIGTPVSPKMVSMPKVMIVEDDYRARTLELGADDYVVKPFSMEELVARVRAATQLRSKSC